MSYPRPTPNTPSMHLCMVSTGVSVVVGVYERAMAVVMTVVDVNVTGYGGVTFVVKLGSTYYRNGNEGDTTGGMKAEREIRLDEM